MGLTPPRPAAQGGPGSAGSAVGAAGLRRLRLAAGLSQEQLAERCQVSDRTIRSLESGAAKRPHHDTLLAVAQALQLHGADLDAFVQSWQRRTRALDEIFHSGPPDDVLRAEFSQQRQRVREQLVSVTARVGADRAWAGLETRRTFRAVTEVSHFVWINGMPHGLDLSELVPVDCVNVEPVDRLEFESTHGVAFLGSLRRTLSPDEVYTLSYAYDYSRVRPTDDPVESDDEIMFSVMTPIDALLFEARFDVAALPARAWRVRQATVDGPPVSLEELPISPFGVVQDLLMPAPAGVHGIRWEWDPRVVSG